MNEPKDGNSGLTHRVQRLETLLAVDTQADEIDLVELFRVVWRGRWLIGGLTALAAIASVAIALWLPNQYRATALLAPASSSRASALGDLASRFGGLASLAGINLSATSEDDKTSMAIALLTTWSFLDEFIRQNNIEVEVFAARGWDRSQNQVVIDPDLYDAAGKRWVRDFDPDSGATAEPSSWELYEKFVERISVAQDEQTGLVTLSLEHYSPYLAKEWVDKLIATINRHLQERDRVEAMKSIEYLNRQAEQTSIAELKNVFYTLIQEQMKELMLAEVSDEYVLQTLSPAKVPEQKSRPSRALICIFSTLIVFVLSLLFVITRHAWRAGGFPSARAAH